MGLAEVVTPLISGSAGAGGGGSGGVDPPYLELFLGFTVLVYVFHTYLDFRQLKAGRPWSDWRQAGRGSGTGATVDVRLTCLAAAQEGLCLCQPACVSRCVAGGIV